MSDILIIKTAYYWL